MKVVMACTALDRLRGLLGRDEFADVLLLAPCNDIHTFGMRHAIDVAFVTRDGVVVESHRGVSAHRRLRCRFATATLERFASPTPWFEQGDRVELKRYVKENLAVK